jgi:hypothetical protein
MKHTLLVGAFALITAATLFTGAVPVMSQTVDEVAPAMQSLDELEPALASPETEIATDEAEASRAAEQREEEEIQQIKKEDVTQPEQPETRDKYLELFENRPIEKVSLSNFFAFAVQYAVSVGVPANTIMLVLLLPFLATMIAFVRHVIGLPTLGLFVPIALSITLIATGVTAGLVLLISIMFGATIAKMLLKRIRIMQLPKVALSMFVVSLLIFITLTFAARAGILVVRQLSIFPVLLLILLSERVVELQLERSLRETITITLVTILLGLAGFALLSSEMLQNAILLYPEIVLLLIPANLLIGRYFGLRLTEYYRFSPMRNAGK